MKTRTKTWLVSLLFCLFSLVLTFATPGPRPLRLIGFIDYVSSLFTVPENIYWLLC